VEKPITSISCCARAMSGHPAAAPPRSAMNARRSLDHLVGAGEQRWRHGQTKRLRSDQVDN
jgi:hypothetical protein